MKRVLATLVLIFAIVIPSKAQYVSGPTPTTGEEQFDKLMGSLRAPATYGGEVKSLSRRRAIASSSTSTVTTHDTEPPASGDPRFSVTLKRIQIGDKNLGQYVVPVNVKNITSVDDIGSVRMRINGMDRAYQNFGGDFDLDKNGFTGYLPLYPNEYGSVRVGIEVRSKSGDVTEHYEDTYEVSQCRVPDLIAIPNPTHGTEHVKFQAQMKGLAENLMLGGAMVVWTGHTQSWAKFDPNKPQNEWPGTIRVAQARVELRNGFLQATAYFWAGLEAEYMFIVPGICGRFAKSDVVPFYTDERPQPRRTAVSINYERPQPGEVLKASATLQYARSEGWLESYAFGVNKEKNWGHFHSELPVRVIASDTPQTGHFRFMTAVGFNYSIRAMYFGLNSRGWLELVAEDETPQNIPGTLPCWFCGDSGGKG